MLQIFGKTYLVLRKGFVDAYFALIRFTPELCLGLFLCHRNSVLFSLFGFYYL